MAPHGIQATMIRTGAFNGELLGMLCEKRHNAVVVMDNKYSLACCGYCMLTCVIYYPVDIFTTAIPVLFNITRYCTGVSPWALGLCGILATMMCFN